MRRGEYPDDWEDRRERVLERDGYECQQCGATDTTLQVHHITPISEGGGHELSNLEIVCRSCHASEHPTKVPISEALDGKQRLRMKYGSSSGTRVRELDPYGMTMHEGIQYLVGHDYYRDEIRIFRPTRIQWAEVLDEMFEPPPDWDTEEYLVEEMGFQRGSQTDCFIATAAYGTPTAEEIEQLRAFRDEVLAESLLTRWTIPTYYALSTPVARWIRRIETRRRVFCEYIITPSFWLVRRLRGSQ